MACWQILQQVGEGERRVRQIAHKMREAWDKERFFRRVGTRESNDNREADQCRHFVRELTLSGAQKEQE